MLRRLWFTALLAPLCLPGLSTADQWQSLFNGHDLTGWQPIDSSADHWHAADGVLYCEGGGGGWLSTTQEYANFELRLEFRVPEGGNSGVFLRAPHQGNPAYAGLEVQVLDDFAPQYAQLQPSQYTGSVYDVAAPSHRVTRRAGQWQEMVILCDGPKVRITINGAPVLVTRLDDHPEKFEKHPGLTRTSGYIGLQNHGTRLEYRNLAIRVLP